MGTASESLSEVPSLDSESEVVSEEADEESEVVSEEADEESGSEPESLSISTSSSLSSPG